MSETVKDAPPLTDENLTAVATAATSNPMTPAGNAIVLLVAEARRLRSDEWLAKAAEEIARTFLTKANGPESLGADRDQAKGFITHLLRKHRDGAA